MTQEQPSNLFDLHIDAQSTTNLNETAKWAKFLAILGFIWCGLIAVVGIFAGSIFSFMINRFNMYGTSEVPASSGFIFTFFYFIFAAVMFFPCLYQYKFATRMKQALMSNDQELLVSSLKNQRLYFRYVGILAIIGLALFILYIILIVVLIAFVPR